MSIGAKVLSGGFHRIHDLANDLVNTSQSRRKKDSESTRIRSGFSKLDDVTSGFQPSDFIVIASRPSVGKSTLALNIARNVAIDQMIPVAFFSLEMSKQSLVRRMLYDEKAEHEGMPHSRSVLMNDLLRFAAHTQQAPLFVHDSAIVTVDDIRDNLQALEIVAGQIGLVIIDYLQLIKPSTSHGRVPEVRETSRRLKYLAREMMCPVIVLSQLSRAVETRANKRPLLRDLSESGSLADDADIVLFLYRDSYYDPESDKPEDAEVIVAKNRCGPIGTIELLFKPSLGKFQNKSI